MTNSALLIHMVAALSLGLIGALIAVWLGQSVILGYVAAGIIIGPFTPGWVGDLQIIQALGDIGVTFLLFTIGVHLSLRRLLGVGKIAMLGGAVQVLLMLAIGYGVGILLLARYPLRTALAASAWHNVPNSPS